MVVSSISLIWVSPLRSVVTHTLNLCSLIFFVFFCLILTFNSECLSLLLSSPILLILIRQNSVNSNSYIEHFIFCTLFLLCLHFTSDLSILVYLLLFLRSHVFLNYFKATKVGKIPWRREWLPTVVFLPGESHGQRRLAGYHPCSHRRVGHDWATNTYIHTRLLNSFLTLFFWFLQQIIMR